MVRKRLSIVVATLLLGGCATLNPSSGGAGASSENFGVSKASSPRADLVYELLAGEIAGKRGAFKEAAKHYSNASKLSEDVGVAERSTRIALFASNWDQALESVERWIELDSKNIEARKMAGLLYVQKKEPQKAFEQFDQVIEQSITDRDTLFNQLGASIGKESVDEETLKVFDLLRQKYADVSAAHLTYAKLAYRNESHEEAMKGLQSVLELEPENTDARILQNRIYLNTGRTDKALESMAILAKQNPDKAQIHLDYARMLVQVKRYPEALEAFGRVMELIPEDKNLVYSTALLHMELGQHVEAREHLMQLVNSPAHKDAAHYYLGRLEEVESHWEKAMSWYLQVGEGEYYYDAHANVAEMQAQLGLIDEARASLQRLRNETAAESVRVRLYLTEGQILRDADMNEEGMRFYDQVLQLYPDNVEVLYARGMLAERLDRLDILETDMLAIIRQEPDNATALNALGYTLADKTDRLDEAQIYIEKALELRPDDAAVLDSMGWVLYRKGQLEKALDYLNKAHALFDDPEISMHLGEVLWALGQRQKAIDTVNKALEKTPEYVGLQQLQKRLTQ